MEPIDLDYLDALIKRGQHSEVRRLIRLLSLSKIPRAQYLGVSKIAYRVNLPYISLKILGKGVKPDKYPVDPLNADEWCEYSVALMRVGASDEALRILDKVEGKTITPLYKAYCHITQRNYDQALPLIDEYLAFDHDNRYQVFIARLNRCASLVTLGRYEVAKGELKDLLEVCQTEGYNLLVGNIYELLAQSYIFTSDYSSANDCLEVAANFLKNTESLDSLFVKKWKTILALFKNEDDAIREFELVKMEAVKRQHWETIRDFDFFESLAQKNKDLFYRVYFGTPFVGYREYMTRLWGAPIQIPKKLKIEMYNLPSRRTFDLSQGREDSSQSSLKEGQLLYNTLKLLASDVYRPMSIGSMFSKLFPEDHFHPVHSPDRIHQAVMRLRRYFKKNEMPLEIKGRNNAYHLKAVAPYSFMFQLNHEIKGNFETYLDKLENTYGSNEFSAAKASDTLGVSKRFINKIVADDGGERLEKVGSGPRTRYIFKSSVQKVG